MLILKHFLLRRAMDEGLEALNDPLSAQDPHRDEEYDSPFIGRGTEVLQNKRGNTPKITEYLWADIPYKGLELLLVDKSAPAKSLHAHWFDTLKIDPKQQNRIPRGRVYIEHNKNKITLQRYDQMGFTPEGIYQMLIDENPKLKSYEVEDKPDSEHPHKTRLSHKLLKKSDVEVHETPKYLPPRDDLRRHLDEDMLDTNEDALNDDKK